MSKFKLCRYTLEQAGNNPRVMAAALHKQLGELGVSSGVVPVEDTAKALDIEDIRFESELGFEGSVVMTPNKSRGSILVKENTKPRMRFTVAHELYHFLSAYHKPVGGGFRCVSRDMIASNGQKLKSDKDKSLAKHYKQEAEANQFAAEMLMPYAQVRRRLNAEPNFEHILSISDDFGVSKETAARHYANRNGDCVAVLFIKDGKLRYAVKSEDFPRLDIRYGQSVPVLPKSRPGSKLSEMEDDDSALWISSRKGRRRMEEVRVQMLRQRDGYGIVLLAV